MGFRALIVVQQEPAAKDIAPELSAKVREIRVLCDTADETFRMFRQFLFQHPPPQGCEPVEWIPQSDQ